MLQRGLLTIAEKQQQLQQAQPPYTRAATTIATRIQEVNLLKDREQEQEQEHLSSKRHDLQEDFRERINCLPIIELPQIKVEQDVEYMEGVEEEQESELELRQDQNDEEEQQAMETDYEELSIKPVPQLLEPTSILKTSLLTGAANTLATLTAAAEQIAKMPNDTLAKSYPYLKDENKRTYALGEQQEQSDLAGEDKRRTASPPTATYTSILQTALMSKRPATINVASASNSPPSLPSSRLASTKFLHVRTPDQVLKTAVTLATLGEIAAQQEQQQQQQKQQQQQQQQQQQKQQPHILVVPQVQRKMCTLPFKKLNFANVTPSSATSTSNTASLDTITTTKSAAATTTNLKVNTNLKTHTNLTNNNSCIRNTSSSLAASICSGRDKLETTTAATFFDTNNIDICSNNNNSSSNGKNSSNYKSQTMATQTLKIPTIKPHLVTTQTQTEETATQTPATLTTSLTLATAAAATATTRTTATTILKNSSASSLQTASSGSSSGGLLTTAVSANTKMLTQNSSLNSLSNKFLPKSKPEANENTAASHSAPTHFTDNIVGNIFKHVSNNNTTLAKMNVIQNTAAANNNSINAAAATSNDPTGSNPNANVTVVVFETLLPED